MTLIAAVLLLAGTLIAAASVAVYVDNAWHEPDWETMRIARVAATISRRAIGAGLLLWIGNGNTASPVVTAALLIAACTALVTYATAPGKLTVGGRSVT